MRNDEAFSLFWELVKLTASKFDVGDPLLPRRRKVSQRYEVGRAEPEFSSSPEAEYKRMYFEALDLVVNCITARFNQPGYVMYKTLEELLLLAANRKEFEVEFKAVTDFYGSDFDSYRLRGQLEVLSAHYKDSCSSVSFHDVGEYLMGLSTALKAHYSEVVTLVKLIQVLPATNATSERTFSAMRRVKSYLRATMTQERLNHLMVLHVHKSKTDSLDLIDVANTFVNSEHRLRLFGKFCESDHA